MWPSHSQWPSEPISFITTMRLPIRQLSCRLLFGKASHHPGLSAPLQPRFGSLQLTAFPKAKIAVEREEIWECDGHTVHKLSQWCLTADWLALRESDCSRLYSKVFSDWLPSYIRATRPVLEIFNMAGYFPDSPRISPFGQLRGGTQPLWLVGGVRRSLHLAWAVYSWLWRAFQWTDYRLSCTA